MRLLVLSFRMSFLVLLLAGFLLPAAPAIASDSLFPEHDCLKANVRFWELVYTQYSNSTGLLHDVDDLSIIYEAIDLTPVSRESVAGKKNSQLVATASDKYRNILRRLADGHKPVSKAEKQVAALFGKNPSRERLLQASNSIRLQICQGDSFLAGLIRSGRYLDKMKEIFKEHGLPTDLVYLPHVESSFNYEAYSRVGAAGIWQFTEDTGKRFLTIDYTVDERRDPIRSTRAAAQYLKANYQLLGSWPLAITAYNHGEGGMMRAKKEKGSFDRIINEYKGKRFGFASRNFYAEFLAARNIAKNYQKYYGVLEKEKPVAIQEIPLTGHVAATDVANYFQIDLDTIKKLNPALRNPIFTGQKHIPKGYELRLPADTKSYLIAGTSLPKDLYQAHQKRSTFYKVQKGDTAGRIAINHRVSLNELMAANNLDRQATIFVGQNLRIPYPAPGKQEMANLRDSVHAASASLAGSHPAILLAALDLSTTWNEAGPVGLAYMNAGFPEEESAEIRFEDRLQSQLAALTISGNYACYEAEENPPIVGQSKPTQAAPVLLARATAESGDFSVHRTYTKKGKPYGRIKVAAGETMSHYAEWLKVSPGELHRLNNIPAGRSLKPDQEITIPFRRVATADFEELRHEYHKSVEEDFFSSYRVATLASYRVQKGDTLWALCHDKLDLPLWLLKRYNESLNLEQLQPNQKLVVPLLVQQT